MSRINVNMPALLAQRELGDTNTYFSKVVQQLSTGLRIIDPGDDPSGLISSQSFRSAISSTERSILNCQEAINFIKTAEGAMDEITRLLRDARQLAVASANSATLSPEQKEANQDQITSISESITRLARNTQYGVNKILDGSAGLYAASVAMSTVQNIFLSGTFGGNPLNIEAPITLSLTKVAEKATIEGKTFNNLSETVGAGAFTINGHTITVDPTETVQDVIGKIQEVSVNTGVIVEYNDEPNQPTKLTFVAATFGSNEVVNITDAGSLILGNDNNGAARTSISENGKDAEGEITIEYDTGRTEKVIFNRGKGSILMDNAGNSVELTSQGALGENVNGTYQTYSDLVIGKVYPGPSRFQVGPNSNHTLNFNLGNLTATQLGTAGDSLQNLTTINLKNAEDASTGMDILDKAMEQVLSIRGRYGNFQRNVLETTARSLTTANLNMKESESTIADIDMASAMSELTRTQILQSSGIAVLSHANKIPEKILSLLS